MSIADKLNYLITTKGLLKDNINKINNVLTDQSTFRTYPQELFNGYLDILNNGTDTLWSNLEKVSQTGTEAVLEGVETAPIKIMLNGNTSQDGTPTPDTPVEVKVVKGENVVSISGENQSDKTDYPINLGDIELCKINTYKDYFHKNSGKWYVHKEIGKILVDENSSVGAYSAQRFRVYVANFVSPSANEKADILCDKLRTVTKNALASTDNVISGSDSGRTGEMLVRINAEINTLELFRQFLAEHNLTIYYLLATPTEEEITNTTLIEQLEAISKAKSVKDKTYITQTNDELPFILDVEAIKEYEVV